MSRRVKLSIGTAGAALAVVFASSPGVQAVALDPTGGSGWNHNEIVGI